MNCHNEAYLGKLAASDAALDQAASEHLITCDRCRKRYLLWLALTQEMSASAPARFTHSARGEDDQKAGDANSTTLKPIALSGTRGFTPRLAALGEQPVSHYQVTSFSNPGQGMIGRLLYDETTRHLQFFLLTESAASVSGIKIILGQGELAGFTDKQGRVDFGDQPPGRYEQIQIVGPNSSIDLSQYTGTNPSMSSHGTAPGPREKKEEFELEIAHAEDKISYIITHRTAANKRTRRVLQIVGITNQRVLTARSHNGVAMLETKADEEMQKIHIY